MSDEGGEEVEPANRKLPPLSEAEKAATQSGPDEDPNSTAEALQLSSGLSLERIKKRALEKEANRTEVFRDHFETLAVISLYLIWFVLVVIGVAWVYHLVAPPSWPRLPDEQVQHLQSILTGGVLAGLASGHVKRRLGD